MNMEGKDDDDDGDDDSGGGHTCRDDERDK